MTVEKVLATLEKEIAPLKVSDDFCKKYGMYDNSGIIINCGAEVNGILFSLDFSATAAERAAQLGYNLIVTHHPAIYGGVSRLDVTASAQSRAISLCLAKGISVISMHLNFDAAPHGIDRSLAEGLGGADAETLCTVEGGAYGRAYGIKPVTLSALIENIKETFSTQRVVCHGNVGGGDGTISKIASFCGAGCDDAAVEFAKRNRVDAVVSSDISHHRIAELVENGIYVIALTHYAAEAYGFRRVHAALEGKLEVPATFFFDGRLA